MLRNSNPNFLSLVINMISINSVFKPPFLINPQKDTDIIFHRCIERAKTLH